MTLPLVVGIQQKFGDNIVFIFEEKSRIVAEGKAEFEYIERRAYMVCVIEIDRHLVVNTEKVTEIFKITRTCKCIKIQRLFNYPRGTSAWKCVDCGIQYGKEEAINELETPRTESDDEILSEAEAAHDVSAIEIAEVANTTVS